MNQIIKLMLLTVLIGSGNRAAVFSQEDSHDHQTNKTEHGHGKEDEHGHSNHESEESEAKLSPKQISLAGIKVAKLLPEPMDYQVYAPGEIKANGYTSYLVSPRVDSVVLRRHASLGDHVTTGQPLVTLFSEVVSEAQARFQITNSEWQRVQKLGRKAVGDKRYIAAQTERQAANSRLLAYGLSSSAIESLQKSSSTLGEYTLNAVVNGAVLTDKFHQGQRMEAGEALMVLADESELWVEARLPANSNLSLPRGMIANIQIGSNTYKAKVSQEAHTIDPETRTRIVRLVLKNKAHRLHPGLFASVFFNFKTENAVIAVPETALMRGSDGDWVVFVEETKGQFKPHEVTLGRSLGVLREIIGIEPGTRVVTEGAFFVASQIAKGGFDPHNH
ncbi:efflux RND transporter periplasmic adaptor subunit [Aliikangiella sp. IMCC44359]|uniref:efflux RND transporter periplasmic adaptor subunit n=1 Tax=Aliikangiella sp. IMCC44359 TaxID=3459125 RepID=UPI00403B0C72